MKGAVTQDEEDFVMQVVGIAFYYSQGAYILVCILYQWFGLGLLGVVWRSQWCLKGT